MTVIVLLLPPDPQTLQTAEDSVPLHGSWLTVPSFPDFPQSVPDVTIAKGLQNEYVLQHNQTNQ